MKINKTQLREAYSKKTIEIRKLWLIDKFAEGSVVDLGCGPGEYLEYFARKSHFCVGLDKDFELCKLAKVFAPVVVGDLSYLPIKKNCFDTIWASEILEHLPDLNVLLELEQIARKKIIITLPNPISPHFKEDPTHILKYSVSSLKKFAKNRTSWAYKVIGLGFDDIPAPRFVKDFSSWLLRSLPWLSPTVGVIGWKKT